MKETSLLLSLSDMSYHFTQVAKPRTRLRGHYGFSGHDFGGMGDCWGGKRRTLLITYLQRTQELTVSTDTIFLSTSSQIDRHIETRSGAVIGEIFSLDTQQPVHINI